MPNKNRDKGNAYERQLAAEFRGLGFPDCCTSRSESKRLDDAGVDLCFTGPFNVQAKLWQRAPSYHSVLDNMPKGINVLIHKRTRKGEVAVLSKEDFYTLLKSYTIHTRKEAHKSWEQ